VLGLERRAQKKGENTSVLRGGEGFNFDWRGKGLPSKLRGKGTHGAFRHRDEAKSDIDGTQTIAGSQTGRNNPNTLVEVAARKSKKEEISRARLGLRPVSKHVEIEFSS